MLFLPGMRALSARMNSLHSAYILIDSVENINIRYKYIHTHSRIHTFDYIRPHSCEFDDVYIRL